MAWGSNNNYYGAPPPTPSALSKVAPLLIFFALVGVVAVVLWHVAKTVGDIANNAGKQLEGRHVLVTKEGVTVGVKEMKNEKYVDRTQSVLVQTWNLSTWPAYKSRFWNRQVQQQPEPRKS